MDGHWSDGGRMGQWKTLSEDNFYQLFSDLTVSVRVCVCVF